MDIMTHRGLSAIYYGLLLSGYENHRDGKPQSLGRWLDSHRRGQPPVEAAFFAAAAVPGREPYAYWPRAFLMECALFMEDRAALRRHVDGLTNLPERDRDAALWAWLSSLPRALTAVQEAPGFGRYLAWEQGWLEACRREAAAPMPRLTAALADLAAPPVTVLLCPIKSAWASDYHSTAGRLVVTGGAFRPESVLHECLHPVVHRAMLPHRAAIAARDWGVGVLDASYRLEERGEGRLNAFEELAVRRLTDSWEQGADRLDIEGTVASLLDG